ncbi:2-C-methyl-D-erythritol 4-phosphate cytidylyltransferase [Comamonas serinivorans]|uniref:2-C-methyl-D-erythritol 4-phosphate cytidylyltransferase n=1 Tax=Comamonas serinivorans TaxID=1082851 RepID=A0A1Y0EQ58_9BURK|nr:2-C-methyl-D-erythritol 4-phosphate cytidylyltransferase [Comamonas serinivorans]ARU05706.1 2-C-methyl-D-erythritol 4-phosphate cytidylyltransferase [Comamonas serinivorans]
MPTDSPIHVLIPAAGVGQRAGTPCPKQYQPVAGAPVLAHTLRVFAPLRAQGQLAQVWLVVAPQDGWLDGALPDVDAHARVLRCGGASRAASVANGLAAMRQAGVADHAWVLVHDAARCLLQPAQVTALIAAGRAAAARGDAWPGALLALPLPDTLKQADAQDRVAATVARVDKWLAQTPQMFRLAELQAALARAFDGDDYPGVTDEASAMEALGARPQLVVGSAQNLKLTYPDDFALAEALLQARALAAGG